MIKDLRSYLKAQIKDVDSSLKQSPSAFYDSDIGESIINNTYHIHINNIVNELRSDHRQDSIDVVISIFGQGYREEIANYDDLLDKALCIRDNVIKIGNFSGQFNIINAEANAISADQLPGNENAFKIDINLTLTLAYTRE